MSAVCRVVLAQPCLIERQGLFRVGPQGRGSLRLQNRRSQSDFSPDATVLAPIPASWKPGDAGVPSLRTADLDGWTEDRPFFLREIVDWVAGVSQSLRELEGELIWRELTGRPDLAQKLAGRQGEVTDASEPSQPLSRFFEHEF